jgi:hypothetical protein
MAPARGLAPSRIAASLAGTGLFDLLAPGLYAWGITVAWPASQRLVPLSVRLLASAALAALVLGAVFTRWWPVAARIVGVWLFVATSVATWIALARAVDPSHLDPVHGLLGSVGWAAFAVVWGGERLPAESAEPPARAAPWPVSWRRTMIIMALVAVTASVPITLAWWVQSLERSLLAHSVSLAAGIALLAKGADLAAPPSRESGPPPPADRPKRRIAGAAVPLVTLVGLAVAGALVLLLR